MSLYDAAVRLKGRFTRRRFRAASFLRANRKLLARYDWHKLRDTH